MPNKFTIGNWIIPNTFYEKKNMIVNIKVAHYIWKGDLIKSAGVRLLEHSSSKAVNHIHIGGRGK